MNIDHIIKELEPLRQQLKTHALYNDIKDIDDVRVFMQNHVFAVWDFMSLLKSLQLHLTTISIPWMPSANAKVRRFVNEIVLGEESDVDQSGKSVSHFEMYLGAMQEAGADTTQIDNLILHLRNNGTVEEGIESLSIIDEVKDFMKFTFEVIATNKPHVIAAVFTFGREDLIPDMFVELVKSVAKGSELKLERLIYYLERHIELDGDEHGPLSLEMVSSLCENEEDWEEALQYSKQALERRIALWTGVSNALASSAIPM
ncbi:DUF3050 domain-containing protein [Aquimarina sp. D1M17]|uniref:DUF3050 domain-containing protein n=1 Tax=Aquimarina acroporae TaxID=2937283 RepID=UPI0020BF6D42|nr:DUF3050 domain-containing protein [Aquimarina acroporae]MCK8521427.1 DUF3050 domain-containing protein [Aquimarina acroporae]